MGLSLSSSTEKHPAMIGTLHGEGYRQLMEMVWPYLSYAVAKDMTGANPPPIQPQGYGTFVFTVLIPNSNKHFETFSKK